MTAAPATVAAEPKHAQPEAADSQDATFRGIIRKHGTSGLTSITPDGENASTWYRPCDANTRDALRRYAPGDSVIIRVRGDEILSVAVPMVNVPPIAPVKPASTPKRAPGTAVSRSNNPDDTRHRSEVQPNKEIGRAYVAERQESQRKRGERLRAAAQESDEAQNAMARLRGVSSTSVLRSADEALDADLDDKHAAILTMAKIKPGGTASGVAFNAKLAMFKPEDAIVAATTRLGNKPNRYKFHNGMLYLSRV